jgi:hypothetical protein
MLVSATTTRSRFTTMTAVSFGSQNAFWIWRRTPRGRRTPRDPRVQKILRMGCCVQAGTTSPRQIGHRRLRSALRLLDFQIQPLRSPCCSMSKRPRSAAVHSDSPGGDSQELPRTFSFIACEVSAPRGSSSTNFCVTKVRKNTVNTGESRTRRLREIPLRERGECQEFCVRRSLAASQDHGCAGDFNDPQRRNSVTAASASGLSSRTT